MWSGSSRQNDASSPSVLRRVDAQLTYQACNICDEWEVDSSNAVAICDARLLGLTCSSYARSCRPEQYSARSLICGQRRGNQLERRTYKDKILVFEVAQQRVIAIVLRVSVSKTG